MYYLINLCENEIVGEYVSEDAACLALIEEVDKSDGVYTEDDFCIADEEDLEEYSLMN